MSYCETREVKANKQHYCLWCGESILKGENYVLHQGANGDCHFRCKYHKECNEAIKSIKDYCYLQDWYDECCMWKHIRGTTESLG